MATNTKARHLEIYAAAAAVVEAAGGTETIDGLPPDERRAFYRKAHEGVMKATGCKIDAAKRNVAKAMRKGRYAEMVARWGGQRDGAGYPKGVPRKAREIETMKATVGNLKVELREALVKKGYSLDDRIDINLVNEVADEIGLPEVKVERFSQVGFYPQRKEDGSFYDK